jgi:hypothetical protein
LSASILESISKNWHGAAAALGGETYSFVQRKVLFGLGMASLMEAIPPQHKKWLGKTITVGVMVGSGAGAVAGGSLLLSTIVGHGASKLAQSRKLSEKAIEERITNVKNGYKIDVNNFENSIRKFEDVIDTTLNKAENTRLKRKLLGGAASLAGTVVTLGATGLMMDHNQEASETEDGGEKEGWFKKIWNKWTGGDGEKPGDNTTKGGNENVNTSPVKPEPVEDLKQEVPVGVEPVEDLKQEVPVGVEPVEEIKQEVPVGVEPVEDLKQEVPVGVEPVEKAETEEGKIIYNTHTYEIQHNGVNQNPNISGYQNYHNQAPAVEASLHSNPSPIHHNLNQEEYFELNKTLDNNMGELFPTPKTIEFWNTIKDSHDMSAKYILDIDRNDILDNPVMLRLHDHFVDLVEETHLKPHNDTPMEFIERAYLAAAKRDILDEIKL